MLQDAVRGDDDTPTRAVASALCTLASSPTHQEASGNRQPHLTQRASPPRLTPLWQGKELGITGRNSPAFPGWVTLDSSPGLSVPPYFHRSSDSKGLRTLTTGVL